MNSCSITSILGRVGVLVLACSCCCCCSEKHAKPDQSQSLPFPRERERERERATVYPLLMYFETATEKVSCSLRDKDTCSVGGMAPKLGPAHSHDALSSERRRSSSGARPKTLAEVRLVSLQDDMPRKGRGTQRGTGCAPCFLR